jgi:hypothetical protein
MLETARNYVTLNVQFDSVVVASESQHRLTWQLEESSTAGIEHVNVEYCAVCGLFLPLIFLTQIFGNFINLGLIFPPKISMFLKLSLEILLYFLLFSIPLTGLVTCEVPEMDPFYRTQLSRCLTMSSRDSGIRSKYTIQRTQPQGAGHL